MEMEPPSHAVASSLTTFGSTNRVFDLALAWIVQPNTAMLATTRPKSTRDETLIVDSPSRICGQSKDPRCLDFHRTERPVRTASATQVRKPVYKSSVGRWRPYEAFLAPLLKELPS